jgi:hypothetical protein
MRHLRSYESNLMRYLRTYEAYNMMDIENIDLIKDKKYLAIIEYYTTLVKYDTNLERILLNIPIDITHIYNIGYRSPYLLKHRFKNGKVEIKDNEKRIIDGEEYPQIKHYNMIECMWMSLKNQHFKRFNEKPYFLIKLLSEESYDPNRDQMAIRPDDKYDKPIVDAMYDYVMEHGEVIYSNRYNL